MPYYPVKPVPTPIWPAGIQGAQQITNPSKNYVTVSSDSSPLSGVGIAPGGSLLWPDKTPLWVSGTAGQTVLVGGVTGVSQVTDPNATATAIAGVTLQTSGSSGSGGTGTPATVPASLPQIATDTSGVAGRDGYMKYTALGTLTNVPNADFQAVFPGGPSTNRFVMKSSNTNQSSFYMFTMDTDVFSVPFGSGNNRAYGWFTEDNQGRFWYQSTESSGQTNPVCLTPNAAGTNLAAVASAGISSPVLSLLLESAVWLNGFVYLIAGGTGFFTGMTQTFLRFELATQTWVNLTANAPYPVATCWVNAVVVNGKIWTWDGQNTGKGYVYDPATNKWTAFQGNPGSACYKACAVGQWVLLVCNNPTSPKNTNNYAGFYELWVFDTVSGSYSNPYPPMPQPPTVWASNMAVSKGGNLYTITSNGAPSPVLKFLNA